LITGQATAPMMTRIDRFARGTGHLKAIVQTKKGTARNLKSDREAADTGDATTPGAFAAFILGLRRREHQFEDVEKTRPALREVRGAEPLRQEGSR
jgi:hypothetical protein